jgi:hypothetical protein
MVCDRRKTLCCRQLVLGVLFLSVTLSAKADMIRPDYASNADDRKLVSKVVDNLISAWNKNDPEAIAKLFLPDGILVTPTGSVIRNRSEIRKRVSGERQGKLKDTTPDPRGKQNLCAKWRYSSGRRTVPSQGDENHGH